MNFKVLRGKWHLKKKLNSFNEIESLHLVHTLVVECGT